MALILALHPAGLEPAAPEFRLTERRTEPCHVSVSNLPERKASPEFWVRFKRRGEDPNRLPVEPEEAGLVDPVSLCGASFGLPLLFVGSKAGRDL